MTGFTRCKQTPMAWKGRIPSVKALEKYVMEFVVSTMKGMCNEHIGLAYGVEIPSRVVVRRNNAYGEVMTEWTAPAFMVLPDPADYPNVAKSLKPRA